MKHSSEIISQLIDYVNELDVGDLFTAVKAYETRNLPVPIKTTYLVFATKENTVTVFSDDNEEYCQRNKVVIRLNCYTPMKTTPQNVYSFVEMILDYINDEFSGAMTGFSIDETEYDSSTNAYKLTALLNFNYEICTGDSSGNSELNAAKEFLCKTHVNDTLLHLTSKDRLYLDSPVVSGTYWGTGSTTELSVELGFYPSAVIVFRSAYHPVLLNMAAESNVNYFAFAGRSINTKGIRLTGTGFAVKEADSAASVNSNTRLNSDGVVYGYLAFR